MNTLKKILRLLYTAWALFLFILFVLTCYFYAVFKYWQKGKRAFFELFELYQWWSNTWMKLTRMKLEVEGSEYFNLRKDYIMVGNHSSSLDIFAMASSVPIPFKALAKKELQDVPVMGFLFKTGCIHVDRNNPESRRKSIEEVKVELALGYSILIMPEGTRNKTSKPLGEFKDGAFRIAIETQTPILPFVILNVRMLMPYPLNIIQGPGTIRVKYLPPVDVIGLTDEDIPNLKQNIYAMIEKILLKEDPFFQNSKNILQSAQ